MYMSKYLSSRSCFIYARHMCPEVSNFLNYRRYHSKLGVYGFKPEPEPSEFIVDKEIASNRNSNCQLYRLICAYRENGHKKSSLDPLNLMKFRSVPDLNPEHYGLSCNVSVKLKGLLNINKDEAHVEEVIDYLKQIYCGSISFEYTYLLHDEEREWMSNKIEEMVLKPVDKDLKVMLAKEMLLSQALDNFVGTKLPTVKRYSGEGAESMLAFFNAIFNKSSEYGIEDVEIGMPHRGRTNLLIGKLNVPAVTVFRMMKSLPGDFGEEDSNRCVGDIATHLAASSDLKVNGNNVHISVLRNPSHLEAVSPVVMGKCRARQQSLLAGDYSSDPNGRLGDKVLCAQVHGDAAYAGQGVVMESLAMSGVPHCNIGGSIHLIVNNQLGFTAPSDRSRSSMYCSDVMKMISAPVIHVNGEDPEAVYKGTMIAMDYRQQFCKDVLVDLVCYRQWGHNELDDPFFTNPLIYRAVSMRKTVPDAYANKLIDEKIVSAEELDKAVSEFNIYLNKQMTEVDSYHPKANYLNKHWSGYQRVPSDRQTWDTGVDGKLLKFVGAKSVSLPDDFNLHPHLQKHFVNSRLKTLQEGVKLDWSTAEAVAIGTLLHQGYHVRLCGQDVGRGTFSQRHAMFVDQETNEMYIPLNEICHNQKGFYEVVNSILSEEACLGFEYGMSIESPTRLNVWEAQFGDFANGAQTIIDTFIFSGDVKWLQQSGLVMLLPHGFDGAASDHSSSHIERFLQLCDSKEDGVDSDNVNVEIVHPTTPAQYFHLLRRQMIRNYRVPLVVASPKILLRLPAAKSSLADMAPGTYFRPVIGDTSVDPYDVKKIIFCSGQHYYNLMKHKDNLSISDTAIVRVEALCPFPTAEIQDEFKKYTKATKFIWSQEEHRNMGCWSFVEARFRNLIGCQLTYAGRRVLGTTAVGHKSFHEAEVVQIMTDTFKE